MRTESAPSSVRRIGGARCGAWSSMARSSTASQSARKRGTPNRSSAAARATSPGRGRRGAVGDSVRRPSRSRSGSVEQHPRLRRHDLDRLGRRRARRPACPAASPRSTRARARSTRGVDVGRAAGELGVHAVLGQVADGADAVAAAGARSGASTPMPKTSSGVARARPGSRSVPVIRPRRTGSLMQTAARGELAGPARAGVEHAVLDDDRGRAPGVPHQRVEVGDVHEQHVVAVGEGMPRGRRPAPAARCAPGRRRGRRGRARPSHSRRQLGLLGALQHHDVDVGVGAARRARPRRRSAAIPTRRACHRPRARVRAASAAGSGGGPGRTPSSTSRERARSRCSRGHLQRGGPAEGGDGVHDGRGRDEREAGMAGHRAFTGARVATQRRWSPSRRCGTP